MVSEQFNSSFKKSGQGFILKMNSGYYGFSNHEQVVCEIFYTDIFGVGHEGVIMYFYDY